MTRLIDVHERRARLGRQHALAARVATAEEACAAVGALHSTDPAAMTLAVAARTGAATPDDLHRALYTDRSLVRLLTMRRTVFAVAREHVPVFLAATAASVGAAQRRRTHSLLVQGGATSDPELWLARVEAVARDFVSGAGVFTTKDLAAHDPLLATRLRFGTGEGATEQSVASRLLTLWSAEGVVVRATVAGGWTSSQFRWASMATWLGAEPPRPDPPAASALVARLYVERYGPVTPEDLQWWTGWTKTVAAAALLALEAAGQVVEVAVAQGPAFVVAGDEGPVAAPEPWVALLPALDPSAMGWKHRDFALGPHRVEVFDRNGNAGPTVWVDGRIVGGWAVRDDGGVGLDLLEPLATHERARLAAQVEALEAFLAGGVPRARARGWTASEKRVRD